MEHTGAVTAEQRQARTPDQAGVVRRDGVSLAYEVFGDRVDGGAVPTGAAVDGGAVPTGAAVDGGAVPTGAAVDGGAARPTVLLMPTWQIVHSRFWKLQIGYLARHHRVVTFDGRGSGRSSRPAGAAAYSNAECAADALAVLDATGTDRAVLVALSCGAAWSILAAAQHPERVQGVFAISPACGFSIAQPHRDGFSWQDRLDTTEGWAKYNRHYWLEGDYDDFLRFFFDKMFSEAHSTKQIEDCDGWGHDITPATLVDATAGRLGWRAGRTSRWVRPACWRRTRTRTLPRRESARTSPPALTRPSSSRPPLRYSRRRTGTPRPPLTRTSVSPAVVIRSPGPAAHVGHQFAVQVPAR